MIFRQFFDPDTSTYSYLLGCDRTRRALLIDPVVNEVDAYLSVLGHLDLHLVDTRETHGHADHITGAGLLRQKLGRTRDAFIELMSRLQLDYPRHIDRALPANKACGRPQTGVLQG